LLEILYIEPISVSCVITTPGIHKWINTTAAREVSLIY
jgi:hypothetical protein